MAETLPGPVGRGVAIAAGSPGTHDYSREPQTGLFTQDAPSLSHHGLRRATVRHYYDVAGPAWMFGSRTVRNACGLRVAFRVSALRLVSPPSHPCWYCIPVEFRYVLRPVALHHLDQFAICQ